LPSEETDLLSSESSYVIPSIRNDLHRRLGKT
jgi:hypothetical protein